MKRTTKIRKYFPILSLILLAVFMRFYRLKDFFPFTIDEEYLSQLAWTIVHDFHVIWIGVSAGSTNFYLGPGYIYVTAFLLWIGKGNPIMLALWVSFVGVLTVISIWFILKQAVSEKTAYIASTLYGLSYVIALYDRHFWPPMVGFMLLWMVFFLWKTLQDTRWFIPFFLFLGISLHLHLSLFVIVPIAAYFVVTVRKNLRISTILASTAVYILAVSPLMVYDYVHNYDNLRAPLVMLTHHTGGSRDVVSRLHSIVLVVGSLFNPSSISAGTGSALLLLLSIGLGVRFKNVPSFITVSGAVTVALLALFFLYPGRVEQYYLIGTFPFFAIMVAYLLHVYVSKKPLRAMLIVYTLANVIFLVLAKPLYNSYAVKEKVVAHVAKITKNNAVLLVTSDNYLYNGGWHFLFTQAGIPVASHSSSEMFSWIYNQYYTPPEKAQFTVILENKNGGTQYSVSTMQ